MKEVARIRDYSVNEFWFNYYVFWQDDNKFKYECGRFKSLKEAIEYIMSFEK